MQLVHKFAATLSNTMIHKQFKNDKKGFGKFGPLAEGRGVSILDDTDLFAYKNGPVFCKLFSPRRFRASISLKKWQICSFKSPSPKHHLNRTGSVFALPTNSNFESRYFPVGWGSST